MSATGKEHPSEISENILSAEQNLGLFQPENLMADLTKIARANTVASWDSQTTPEETTAYFLGQEILCHCWRCGLKSHEGFLNRHYFGEGRFKNQTEVLEFLRSGQNLSVKEILVEPASRSRTPNTSTSSYLAVRVEKSA